MSWTNTAVIQAPAATVWNIVSDVTSWPDFLPTMQRVTRVDQGPLRLGSSAMVKQPLQRSALWTVTDYEPNTSFVWESHRKNITMTGIHIVKDLGHCCENTLCLEVKGTGARFAKTTMGFMFQRVLVSESKAFARYALQRKAITDGDITERDWKRG
ncbi:hypothetical protein BM536_001980 [Streptomyces phaeoluteigriseus]|uniref:Polyketide cyclase n=1 Tax=Streptomyces phaeoluteigriseus TaxID=114686 RepID=A0A1V6MYT1_9ACTN|nr:SRPBCC family protein [Streptomyces phaeoluteigriseus]OQD57542.1 hypothetical protein BM536_001980 [Streptomyces phaeoluteigriseus]